MDTHTTTFKRIEMKYLLTLAQKNALIAFLGDTISPDAHGSSDGRYQLESLYYDTDDLAFYQEKLDHSTDGHKKLRIRRYVNVSSFTHDSPVFVEIKEKKGEITEKRRVKLSYTAAKNLIETAIIPKHASKDASVIDEIAELAQNYILRPQVITSYDRQAFFGKDTSTGLRMTFDTNVVYKRQHPRLASGRQHDGTIIDPNMAILEVKALGSLPKILEQFFQEHGITPIRMSKYARAVAQHRTSENNLSHQAPQLTPQDQMHTLAFAL